jgi:hypothetical protein
MASLDQSVLVADRKGVLATSAQHRVLLLPLLLAHEFQVLLSEVGREVLEHPLVPHQLKRLHSAVGIPAYLLFYH